MNLQGREDAPMELFSVVGVILIATLVSIYMVSQTLRNSIGVIAPDLAAELGLSASQIGFLSSAFFISFSVAQLPLGIALDRFGPKRCILVCTTIVIAGTMLFATAPDGDALIFARILIGLGASCYLMAPLAFYAQRFSPERFSTIAGIQLSLGTLGTLFATAPLALSTAAIGWRTTFWLIAGAIAVCGVLVMLVVPGERGHSVARSETWKENLSGTLAAIRISSVTRLFLMQVAAYSSFALFVGLWGGPYLTHVYGYSLVERGDLLFLAAAGQVIGLMLNGPLERGLRGHKTLVLVGSILTALLLFVLAAVGALPALLLPPWLFAFGLVSAFTPALIAHGKSLFPPALLGRGLTWLNIGSMGGVFLTQAVSGGIIDLFPVSETGAYSLQGYRLVFVVQAILLVIAVLFYRHTLGRRPEDE